MFGFRVGFSPAGLPWIWNFPSISISISRDFCVDIHGYIHIDRRLSCLHVATKFPQSTAGAKGVHPTKTKTQIFPSQNCYYYLELFNNKHIMHWNMCFVKYFQNFYENLFNTNAPGFFQDAGCIHFCMEWTPLMHVWFLLPTSIENVGKQKENVCSWLNENTMLSVYILYVYVLLRLKYRNKM